MGSPEVDLNMEEVATQTRTSGEDAVFEVRGDWPQSALDLLRELVRMWEADNDAMRGQFSDLRARIQGFVETHGGF